MMKDLNAVALEVQAKYRNEFSAEEFLLSEEFKEAYGKCMRKSNQNVEFTPHTAIVTTAGNLKMYIPNQWFRAAAYAVPLLRELVRYKAATELIISKHCSTSKAKSEYIKRLKEAANVDYDAYKREISEFIQKVQNSPDETEHINFLKIICDAEESRDAIEWGQIENRLCNFACDYDWWYGSKTIDRSDYYVSPILNLLNVVNVSQAYIADIAYQYATNYELLMTSETMIDKSDNVIGKMPSAPVKRVAITRLTGGINLIVYGAPGTGKSKYLDDTYGKPPLSRRVVFHPEYSYFDFVGTYKPVPVYKKSMEVFENIDGSTAVAGEPFIDYRFVSGPFIDALVEAWLDPDNMHTLIIEEINRANAASVFGEVFQLLDRDVNGCSEYSYTPSEDIYRYLLSIPGMNAYISDGVRIPSNLNIVATMNSADQGVKPVDSAFKRRWGFHYIKINFDGAVHEKAVIRYAGQDVYWGELVRLINNKLSGSNFRLDEDKLIGPYFIKPDELGKKYAVDKLLLYLWDDVLRHSRDAFFDSNINTFSELSERFEDHDVFAVMAAKDTDSLTVSASSADETDDETSQDDVQE